MVPAAQRSADEMTEHLLGDLEVGDHAVAKRARRADVGGCAADHLPCLGPDGLDLTGPLVDRDHRRLEQHDSLPAPEDDRVGRA